jgi:diacylglycerol O-acyltransferase / wax synthase
MSTPSKGDSEPVSIVDAAWLRMDRETNPMVITAVLVLEGALSIDGAQRLVTERLLKFDRFRQRVSDPGLPLVHARWEDDPLFDLRSHVHRVGLPAPGDRAALAEVVSDLMSTPLDHHRPLWQLHVIEGVTLEDGRLGTALVTRIHHAVADGVALVRVLLALTDEGADLPIAEVGLADASPPKSLGELARRAVLDLKTLLRLLVLPPDPRTPLRGTLGVRKRVAWSDALPLERVKGIARATGVKVNDVLVAAVTSAVRTHLLDRDGLPSGREIRAMVPVYVRGAEDQLGNHFGLVYLDLPIDVADPLDRVHAVKARMDAIKGSPEAHVAVGVLGAIGAGSAAVEGVAVDLFTSKASVLVTNVPGPPVPVHLAGHPLDAALVWAPVSGAIGLGFSLLSYAGKVRLGVASDARIVSDPGPIARAFEQDLEAIATALERAAAPSR